MTLEKTTYLDCSRDFSRGAVIKTESGHFLGATCDPKEAENIIRKFFLNDFIEFFPEAVHVYFDGENGKLGYTFRVMK